MRSALYRIIIFSLSIFTFACSSVGLKQDSQERAFAAKSLSASGTGIVQEDAASSKEKLRLTAEQKAKMNAYRSLASMLYKEKLSGGMTVGGQVVGDESYRIYLDTYLREAKVNSVRALGNAMYATLTLTLSDRFYRCMSGKVDVVRQCLQQDNKMLFTRLGYNSAEVKSVNLACGTADCAGMLDIQGFTKRKNAVDRTLLNAGLYDGEWIVNSAGRLLINFVFLNNVPEL